MNTVNDHPFDQKKQDGKMDAKLMGKLFG